MAEKLSAPPPAQLKVVVLGGGLAGMAAACHLLDAGHQVTLVEKRPYLGGRTFSFTDRETGQMVDNGQHVFLGCCDYYINFLKKLGTYHQAFLQPKLQVKVLNPGQKTSYLSSAPLPKPLHLLPSFLTYRHMGLKDKVLALYALVRIALTNRHRPALQNQSFHQWLKDRHQTQHSIDNFWNLIIKPCVNDDVGSVSASMAMMIFQEGFIKARGGSRVGYSRVGLSELMGQASRRYIEALGGRLLLGKTVGALKMGEGRVAAVELADGSSLKADAYVSALPFDALLSLLPTEVAKEPYFAGLGSLTTAPIVNIHLWYDRKVMTDDFAAVVDSPLQWVFNRSLITGDNGSKGQNISISLSGAFEHINRPKEELQETFIEAMAQAFPLAREAKVERVLVIKQEKATFRCLPESEGLRPTAKSPVENLVLAGEWTDTGWPSTMEGAVRSGVTAARVVAEMAHR